MRRLAVFLIVAAAACAPSSETRQVSQCRPTVWVSCVKGKPTFRCYIGRQYPKAWRCGVGQSPADPGKTGAW